jgi:hypothetical protein
MFVSPIVAGLTVLVIGACAFAFWKGGQAERLGAAVILTNLALSWAANGIHYRAFYEVFGLVLDGLTAVVLLVIVLRYASGWLGAVMLLYGLQFTLHAYYFVTQRPFDHLHAVVNNSDFMGVVWCVVIGTALAWRKRVRLARQT